MNGSDMVRIRSAVNAWLDSPGGDLGRYRALARDPELQVNVKIFVDIITELGIAYRYRSVSRDLVLEIWYPFIPSYWERMQFYVYAAQLEGTRTGYWFRYLAEEITKHADEREHVLSERYALPERYYSTSSRAWLPIEALKQDAEADR